MFFFSTQKRHHTGPNLRQSTGSWLRSASKKSYPDSVTSHGLHHVYLGGASAGVGMKPVVHRGIARGDLLLFLPTTIGESRARSRGWGGGHLLLLARRRHETVDQTPL